MATRKSTRPKATPSPSAPAKRRHRKPSEELSTPAERMHFILRLHDEHACPVSSNVLVGAKTPKEALAACRQFAKAMFVDVVQHDQHDGRKYLYQMLYSALEDIEKQLEPLFDCARQVAETHS